MFKDRDNATCHTYHLSEHPISFRDVCLGKSRQMKVEKRLSLVEDTPTQSLSNKLLLSVTFEIVAKCMHA